MLLTKRILILVSTVSLILTVSVDGMGYRDYSSSSGSSRYRGSEKPPEWYSRDEYAQSNTDTYRQSYEPRRDYDSQSEYSERDGNQESSYDGRYSDRDVYDSSDRYSSDDYRQYEKTDKSYRENSYPQREEYSSEPVYAREQEPEYRLSLSSDDQKQSSYSNYDDNYEFGKKEPYESQVYSSEPRDSYDRQDNYNSKDDNSYSKPVYRPVQMGYDQIGRIFDSKYGVRGYGVGTSPSYGYRPRSERQRYGDGDSGRRYTESKSTYSQGNDYEPDMSYNYNTYSPTKFDSGAKDDAYNEEPHEYVPSMDDMKSGSYGYRPLGSEKPSSYGYRQTKENVKTYGYRPSGEDNVYGGQVHQKEEPDRYYGSKSDSYSGPGIHGFSRTQVYKNDHDRYAKETYDPAPDRGYDGGESYKAPSSYHDDRRPSSSYDDSESSSGKYETYHNVQDYGSSIYEEPEVPRYEESEKRSYTGFSYDQHRPKSSPYGDSQYQQPSYESGNTDAHGYERPRESYESSYPTDGYGESKYESSQYEQPVYDSERSSKYSYERPKDSYETETSRYPASRARYEGPRESYPESEYSDSRYGSSRYEDSTAYDGKRDNQYRYESPESSYEEPGYSSSSQYEEPAYESRVADQYSYEEREPSKYPTNSYSDESYERSAYEQPAEKASNLYGYNENEKSESYRRPQSYERTESYERPESYKRPQYSYKIGYETTPEEEHSAYSSYNPRSRQYDDRGQTEDRYYTRESKTQSSYPRRDYRS